jgi:DNA polymerase alpha subunit B
MSLCVDLHVPKNADLIFVQYAFNDAAHPTPYLDNPQRRELERLLRKLLRLPNAPAVILLNAYSWLWNSPPGQYWAGAEAEFFEFATFYQLPLLSLKACCYHLLAVGQPPFYVDGTTNRNNSLLGSAFYRDKAHPDGQTGHRVIAELAMQLLYQTSDELLREHKNNSITGAHVCCMHTCLIYIPASHGKQRPQPPPEQIPPPMFENNYESGRTSCFIDQLFQGIVAHKDGFEWVSEHGKAGFIATQPGSVLSISLNTTMPGSAPNETSHLELMYLKSYEHMVGCSCCGNEDEGGRLCANCTTPACGALPRNCGVGLHD